MGADELKPAPVAARENSRAERRAASRLVLRHARSREDLRLLLDALGLNRRDEQ